LLADRPYSFADPLLHGRFGMPLSIGVVAQLPLRNSWGPSPPWSRSLHGLVAKIIIPGDRRDRQAPLFALAVSMDGYLAQVLPIFGAGMSALGRWWDATLAQV
jgi:hypothetical protein